MSANTPTATTAGNPPAQLAARPLPSNVPQQMSLPKDQYLPEEQKTEQNYLKKVNDLEELKVERQIEETNQAIAVAKLATVTAEKSTADLLTKPTPVVAEGAYANQLVNPTASGTAVATSAPPKTETPEVAYTVISVSLQLNKWTAVIGTQGKLYNVSVGDILPLDGSVVSSISKSGVILKKDDKARKISIVSAI
jgi:hypothetical protein